jgi:alpha-glucosidase
MENSRATYEGLKTLDPGVRPFVLTRATYAGGQRYAATWTGDNSSSWNHLRMTTPMLENLGLSGFAYTGADVGGFAGTPSPDLLTKWMEIAAFQPIDRDHTELGTGDQEPWVGGPEQEAIRRRFIETRYRLLPYLYTLAEDASRTGLPMVRPLFLEFPDAAPDKHPIDIDVSAAGEFLLGRDLLIAGQAFPGELDRYQVEFPSEDWYNYWTGEKVPVMTDAHTGPTETAANQVRLKTTIQPALDALPVFARGGSILPIAPLVQSTGETPQGPLTLRVYTGEDCEGTLYQDDGQTFNYQQGQFLRMKFDCRVASDGFHLRISPHEGSYSAWWKSLRVEIYGWNPQQNSALLNGKAMSSRATAIPNGLAINVPDDGRGAELNMR